MADWLTALEAAALLGVKLDTLYVYVSRKGIRSVPSADKTKRLYWRADVEQARRGRSRRPSAGESTITLYTNEDLFYRGRSVRELADTATFEQVAALLWDVDATDVFTAQLPASPDPAARLFRELAGQAAAIRALCLFPLIEAANPRSFDLSAIGMARTGADVLRWLCALTLGRPAPVVDPIHEVFATALGLSPVLADLVRRVLVLSADHGLESATFAVRAIASTGVSPWRFVAAGLSVMSGRRDRIDHFARVERMVAEILDSDVPEDTVMRWMEQGESVPGFQRADSFRADARVRILHGTLRAATDDDAGFRKLERAAAAVRETQCLEPTFAYLSTFVWRMAGLHSHEAAFMLGRTAGWIGHAIEQYQAGERERVELHYRGPLPTSQSLRGTE
jgi:citrate synthase